MKKLILLLLASAIFFPNIYAIGHYSKGDTLNVFAFSGLRLRDKPGGAVIATVPYGSEITMKESQPNDRRDTVENIPGHWAKTVWQGMEGYVFDGFLSRLSAPNDTLQSIQDYYNRYFKTFIPDVNSKIVRHHNYQDWQIELSSSESTEEAEAYGYGETITFKNSGLTPEEMYLLMRALFRNDIAKCLEKIKTEQTDEFYKTMGPNYFQFVRDAKSGSYEFPAELYLFLDYGVCIHGAYISFGAAD